MKEYTKNEITKIAKKEIEDERRDILVAKEKERLKNKPKFLIPWRLKLIRID